MTTNNKNIKIFFLIILSSGICFGIFMFGKLSAKKTTITPPYQKNITATSSTKNLEAANDPTPSSNPRLRDLIILNQLFNSGRKFPLDNKKPLEFSDLVTLNKLFEGQVDNVFDTSGGPAKINIGDLIILNQLFNSGKALPGFSSTSSNSGLGNLIILYELFSR